MSTYGLTIMPRAGGSHRRRLRTAATALFSLFSRRQIGRVAVVVLAGSALTITPAVLEPAARAAEDTVVSTTLLQGFRPAGVEIQTGSTVIWRNDDRADVAQYPLGRHQIRADDGSFESPVLAPGASFALAFTKPGTYPYRCALHPSAMAGRVVAIGPAITEAPKGKAVAIVERGGSDYGFDPQDIVIPVGTTVTWRNNGSVVHTATAAGVFDSGDLSPGQKFSFTFNKAMSIRYVCTPHKDFMSGTIRVAAKGAPPPPPPPPPKQAQKAGPVAVPKQAPRKGNEPATFTVLAVEPPDVANWGFAPRNLRIRAGDTVVWRNSGSATHTVTDAGGAFDANLAPSATFSRTFKATANFAYACKPHPWMKGSITVVPATATGPSGAVQNGALQEPGSEAPATNAGQQPSGARERSESVSVRLLRSRVGWALTWVVLLFSVFMVIPPIRQRRRRRRIVLPDPLAFIDEREPVGIG